ncbi:hypothetical protein F5890DRAFT_1476031 [Lentinula detonsa]|uniref:Uncharacterized protein n=1 Tax=Lentinula detonsa TaxID=2804962 RepID=A0AA38PVX1_9AGAR|nr:hypothetical protein F5890DRAFT_1476031 [Lentinula detonsa]
MGHKFERVQAIAIASCIAVLGSSDGISKRWWREGAICLSGNHRSTAASKASKSLSFEGWEVKNMRLVEDRKAKTSTNFVKTMMFSLIIVGPWGNPHLQIHSTIHTASFNDQREYTTRGGVFTQALSAQDGKIITLEWNKSFVDVIEQLYWMVGTRAALEVIDGNVLANK